MCFIDLKSQKEESFRHMTTIVIEQMSETMYVGIISKRRKIFTGSTLYSREEAGKREREREEPGLR